MTNFAPTQEQQSALDAFATGEDMVIDAGAGTGKTSTLRLLGESTDERGLYLAYNKAIQLDADASFPGNVECRTAHSVAYGWFVRQPDGKVILAKMKTNSRVPSWQAAKAMGIPSQGFHFSDETGMAQRACATAVMKTVSNFCNSAAAKITERHVSREFKDSGAQSAFETFLLRYARWAWEDIQSPRGKLRFIPDHYLKMWSLSKPRLKTSFILFDEAQDANPCIAEVVLAQSCQKVFVGDRCQAIYGWRGAIDAMSTFDAPHKLVLTQSFRFGPAVAEQANRWLDILDAPLRLVGFDKIDSKVETLEDPDAILCRTNAAAVAHAMIAQGTGKRVALVGGTGEIERFTKAAARLMEGNRVEHEDLINFETWIDVVAYTKEDDGRDLRVLVSLIEDYGTAAILEVCSSTVNEDDADIIVSTAHKAKGREWDRVKIAGDFKAPQEGEQLQRSEAMLAYVAVTRARKVLDYSGLAWIDRYAPALAV